MNDLHLPLPKSAPPPWFYRPSFCMIFCVEKKTAIGKWDEGNQSFEGEGSAKIGCRGVFAPPAPVSPPALLLHVFLCGKEKCNKFCPQC